MRGLRFKEGMRGNAPKSNLRGYAAAGLEASLHNLLTRARLWRVLTHCTWEKTTVAISKCGSKVGRVVSSVCMPFLGCMVRRGGGECWCVVAFSRTVFFFQFSLFKIRK
jgi:hypothetical protein